VARFDEGKPIFLKKALSPNLDSVPLHQFFFVEIAFVAVGA
jgi:hypothetical protein